MHTICKKDWYTRYCTIYLLNLEDFSPFWKILSVRGVSNWHSHLGIKFLPLLNISQSFTTKHTMQQWIRKKKRSFKIKMNDLMSCLVIQFDVMKATILDSLVSCSLITAMRSLISPVILCRHSLKTPNKNNNKKQIVWKLLSIFYNREFVFTSGRCLLLFFQIWFLLHLISPVIFCHHPSGRPSTP